MPPRASKRIFNGRTKPEMYSLFQKECRSSGRPQELSHSGPNSMHLAWLLEHQSQATALALFHIVTRFSLHIDVSSYVHL